MRVLLYTIAVSVFVFQNGLYGQMFLDADSTGDAYLRVRAKGHDYEVPDCGHPVRHIFEPYDGFLQKYVFAFTVHKSLDDDRCINFDRQRVEIKTWSSSPDSLKAFFGETLTLRWKFKLDAAFQPSANFTHIHQLKAGDGTVDTDTPIMTLTARYGSPNKMEVSFTEPIENGGDVIKLAVVNLAPFLGTWVEAYETTRFHSSGSYTLVVRRVSDDSVLLSFTTNNLALWRTGITFVRPKYGIYRSLLDSNRLRDETILFADFCLKKGTGYSAPAAPTNLSGIRNTANSIRLQWADRSPDEIQFRIERSDDGARYAYLASAPANTTAFTDTTAGTGRNYYYRVRAENTHGNSGYSNFTLTALPGDGLFHPAEFSLEQNFPNPFNPVTSIQYGVGREEALGNRQEAIVGSKEYGVWRRQFVSLKVFDVLGREVAVLGNEEQAAGNYEVKFDASALPSGTYFYELRAGGFRAVRKMIFLK